MPAAVLCVVLLTITFLTTRERILPDPKQKSAPRQDFSNLAKNGPWVAMFTLTLFHFIFVAMRGGMGTLTEISLIWNMLQTKTMADKPIVLVGKFWRPMLQSISTHLVISAEELDIFRYAETPDEAVKCLLSLHSADGGRP